MTLQRLDEKALAVIKRHSWAATRPQFEAIHNALIAVSDGARGEMTTSYVKYLADDTGRQPYAVVWIKMRAQLVVGLSLPEYEDCELAIPSVGFVYKGLTTYLKFEDGDRVPEQFGDWARTAYQSLLQ